MSVLTALERGRRHPCVSELDLSTAGNLIIFHYFIRQVLLGETRTR